ncbi:uncharacterized protein LOC123544727 isoform X2 [Mercenaria mercenaria]|uniref:uncharacterized protein LOC123544727 isoform X2 n=1 Tax=Mercenaria mercenaria TaxID=6596 RepID=UPI00234E465D|nr:uncharacterized protein LOC123544727 isoform X2 [Mercenaria mercenaria]
MIHITMAEGHEYKYNYVLLQSDESTDSAEESANPLYSFIDTDNKKDVSIVNDGQEDKNYEYIWLSDDEIISETKDSTIPKANAADNKSGQEGNILKNGQVGAEEHKDVSEGENSIEVTGPRSKNIKCEGQANEWLDTVKDDCLHSDLPEKHQNTERNTDMTLDENSSAFTPREDVSDEALGKKLVSGSSSRRNSSDAILTRKLGDPDLTKSDITLTRNFTGSDASGIVSDEALTRNVRDSVLSGNICDQTLTRTVSINQTLTRKVSNPASDKSLIENISDTALRSDELVEVEGIVHDHESNSIQKDTAVDIVTVQERRSSESNKADNNCGETNHKMEAVVVDNNLADCTVKDNTILLDEKPSEVDKDNLLLTNRKCDLLLDTIENRSKKKNIRTPGRWHKGMVNITNAKILKYLHNGKKNKHCTRKLETAVKSNSKDKYQADGKLPELNKYKDLVTSSKKKRKVKPEQDVCITSELCPAFDRCALIGTTTESDSLFGDSLTNVAKEGLTEKAKEGLSENTKGELIASEKGFWIRNDNAKEEFWIRKNEALYGLKKICVTETKGHCIAMDEKASENENSECSKPMLDECNVKAKQSDIFDETKEKSENTDTVKSNQMKNDEKYRDKKNLQLKKMQSKPVSKSENWMRFMPTPTTGKLLEGKLKLSKQVKTESLKLPKAEVSAVAQDLKDVYEIENIDVMKNDKTRLYKRKVNNERVLTSRKEEELEKQTGISYSEMKDNERGSTEKIDRKVHENQDMRNEHNEICQDNIKTFESSGQMSNDCPNASEVNNNTMAGDKAIDSEPLTGCSGKTFEKDTVKLKRKRIRRKPVKVFSIRNGVRKIAFRYPCRYCGELFSSAYVRLHERKHGIEGQKKVYRRRTSDERADDEKMKVDDMSPVFPTRNYSLTAVTQEQISSVDSNTGDPAKHNIDAHCRKDGKTLCFETKEGYSEKIDIDVKKGFKTPECDHVMTNLKDKKKKAPKDTFKKKCKTRSLQGKKLVTKQYANIVNESTSQLQVTSDKKVDDANTEESSINENAIKVKKELKHLDKNGNPLVQLKEEKLEELCTKTYSCTECSYTCSYKNILKRHLSIHKSISKRIVTCKCGIMFRSRSTLGRWHKKNNICYQGDHVREKIVGKRKQSGSKVKNHWRKLDKVDNKILKSFKRFAHKRERKKCGNCNYRFSNRARWLAHEKLHETNSGSTCEVCSITMKTRFSLACWHYRHGIHHHKRQTDKKIKVEVIEKNKNHSSLCDPGDNRTEQIGSEALEIQGAKNHAASGMNSIKNETKLNEKLDGTICDAYSPESETVEESEPGTPSVTVSNGSNITVNSCDASKYNAACNSDMKNLTCNVRESINNSLKELTKKLSVYKEDKPWSHSIETLKEITVDGSKTIAQCSWETAVDTENLSRDRFLHSDNSHTVENKRLGVFCTEGNCENTMGCKELPVYPLVKKLSLRDGEMIFSPVNNEIEVFEKESDINENYRKIKVLDIDTAGCLEKPDVVLESIVPQETKSLTTEDNEYGIDSSLESQLFCRNEINEVISGEPVDLSVKRTEVENESLEDNRNVSIMFEIQIDLERKGVATCSPLTQQIHNSGIYGSGESLKHNTNSITAKVILRNLNVMENIQAKDNDNCNKTNKGAENTDNDKKVCPKDTNICKRKEEIAVRTENSYNDKLNVNSYNRDVTFTEDEDDDVYYYASKLQEKPCIDEYALDLDSESDDQLDDMGADTGETSVCDTGETDENNNRSQGGNNKMTDRKINSTGEDGDRNTGDDEGRRNSGGGEGDDNGDEKENNDNNNGESNRDENHNVELFPCLVCQETFNNKIELLRHLSKIHRLTNMCQICYFDEGKIRRFANPVSLRNHKVRDHPEDMVKCVCGAMLIDNKMLSSHLKKFKCNIYDTVGEPNEMAKCICGKRFASQEMLCNHRSKCRKRHCLDDTFLEYMSSSQKGKRRCLKTSTAENLRNNENTGMRLRAKVTDINNNMSMSEDSDASHGRTSKVRKCKENVVTYSERLYDKYFETAVSLSKRSRRKSFSETEHTKRYERLPTSQKLSDIDEVLDLRTKSVRERNNNTLSEKVNDDGCVQPDLNNNTSQDMWTVSNFEFKSDCKSDHSGSKDSVQSKQEYTTNRGSGVKLTLKKHCLNKNQKQISSLQSQSLAEGEKRLTKSEINSQCKKPGNGKRKRRFEPDVEGRYPCKICRRRYKRPYLYTHQKIAHAKKQWVLVPTASLQKKPGKICECKVSV